MKKILILLLFISNLVNAQVNTKIDIEEIIKDR